MQLPATVIPILEATVRGPAVARGLPLEFWRHGDHRTWIDAFMEFGAALQASDIPQDELPRGYGLIAHLFDWEAQCQFSGWNALDNRRSTIDDVIGAYDTVGLHGEAAALRRAFVAWDVSGGDHEATSAAYGQETHDYCVDLDRLEYLAAHFIDHADELLYVSAA